MTNDLDNELRELVEKLREFSEPPAWDEYSQGVRDSTKSCADELEKLLDKHADD